MEPNAFDELDHIIDAGLANYASREPLAGLEDRVLNRVRGANAGGRRFRHGYWGLVVAAVGALIIVAVLPRGSRAPVEKPVPAEQAEAASPVPAARVTPAALARLRLRPRHKAVLPKRDQFPTPTPLTPEERALIALAQLPPAELAALTDSRRSSEELRIAPIEISPLEIDGNR
jgi:hypothetical protein